MNLGHALAGPAYPILDTFVFYLQILHETFVFISTDTSWFGYSHTHTASGQTLLPVVRPFLADG